MRTKDQLLRLAHEALTEDNRWDRTPNAIKLLEENSDLFCPVMEQIHECTDEEFKELVLETLDSLS
jgi:hypothetical protein